MSGASGCWCAPTSTCPCRTARSRDATRLERLVPGLQDLARRGARVIVISHFGRPKGGPDPQFSLKPVADKLGRAAGHAGRLRRRLHRRAGRQGGRRRCGTARWRCWRTCASTRARRRTTRSSPRRWPRSATSSSATPSPAAHRAHASTEAIARLLPAYAGPLLMEEIDALRERAREAGAPGGRRDRRRQGVEQDRRAHQPRRQGRQADHRRRHGQHVLPGRGRGDRQVAGRARPRQDRARDHACRQGAPLRGDPAARLRGGRQARSRRALARGGRRWRRHRT